MQNVDKLAKILKLSDFLPRKSSSLSGVQRQWGTIDRTMLRTPGAFLFDDLQLYLYVQFCAHTGRKINKLCRKRG